MSIAHWSEVEKHHRAKGPMDATWSRLGDAAGAKGVGVSRIEIAPGIPIVAASVVCLLGWRRG